MSQHTPGPWTVGYLDKHSQRVVSGPHFEVATLWHHSVGAIEQEMEANAKLIAAAPDLLEALRAILVQIIQGPVLERDACITQARAALTKATSNIQTSLDHDEIQMARHYEKNDGDV